MIVGPPLDGSSNELADWLELEVFISEHSTAPLQAVNQTLEIAEDEEPEQLDGENLQTERRLQQLCAAIYERRNAIPGYPFNVDGTSLSLKSPIGDGGYAYLFCLIVSAAAPNGFLAEESDGLDLNRARDLFQVCATVAAAGFTGGPAFSTGWPRPDCTNFLEKLRRVYGHFGNGQVHDAMPPGAPRQVKDDEIDVIAWKHDSGLQPPTGYFLGQAASGANWQEKSLRHRARVFHGTWFSTQPSAPPSVGTIIPFCLGTLADAEPSDHDMQAEILGTLRRQQLEHEEILFRHRVAKYLDEGVQLHQKGIGPIERIPDLPQIAKYVESYRTQLRVAARAL